MTTEVTWTENARAAWADARTTGGAGDFASPLTRMLLSSEGMTTTLLEAWAGRPLRPTAVALERARPAWWPREAELLRVPEDGPELLVRRSRLVTPEGDALSRNRIVACGDMPTELRRVMGDASAPLGPALQAAGTGFRRTLLAAGTDRWAPLENVVPEGGARPEAAEPEAAEPGAAEPEAAEPGAVRAEAAPPPGAGAAFKTYLLWHGEEPFAVVTEVFNPDFVPALRARRADRRPR
ncbi:hypothetical protein [Streptomyces alkaliterrae]|uniref:Chorismate lyase n=1 Tax=Streptomyces alkaliterrae TaxID=2213162 RepID=A0A5P0YWV4_9ACTN|nr:hypothetical protein [Streptomyces alkaliterrae]MBB1262084.1 hypothetical protein [Streptomyces alkaliterrae]MQS04756.1 hypothetical protein [Streptomyces alkaliterrae]